MDFEAFANLFAEDAVQENPYGPPKFPERIVGRETLKEHYTSFGSAYESMRFIELELHPIAPALIIVMLIPLSEFSTDRERPIIAIGS